MPLRPTQWVSVSGSPGFAVFCPRGAFSSTGTNHPVCLTGKVNLLVNQSIRIRARCVIAGYFAAEAKGRPSSPSVAVLPWLPLASSHDARK
jgi:hypothetical protein